MSTPRITLAEAEALHRAGEEQRAFWDAHYDEFLARYPDQWVAVKDGHVIAVNPDLYELVDDIKRRGIHPADTWVEHFSTKNECYML